MRTIKKIKNYVRQNKRKQINLSRLWYSRWFYSGLRLQELFKERVDYVEKAH